MESYFVTYKVLEHCMYNICMFHHEYITSSIYAHFWNIKSSISFSISWTLIYNYYVRLTCWLNILADSFNHFILLLLVYNFDFFAPRTHTWSSATSDFNIYEYHLLYKFWVFYIFILLFSFLAYIPHQIWALNTKFDCIYNSHIFTFNITVL